MDLHVFFVSDHMSTHIPAHLHEFYQLIFCKSGTGRITIRDTEYCAQPGQVYFAAPGVLHAIDNTGGLAIQESKFFARDKFAEQLNSLPDTFSIADNAAAKILLQTAIREGLEKRDHYNSAVDSGFVLFFVNVLRSLGNTPAADPVQKAYAYLDMAEETNRDADVIVIRLRAFIEEHLDEEITLDTLASQVHFNKTYFVKRFKELWGFPPMKYVNSLRIQNAERLLLTTELSLTEIARQCGFSSLHYFSRKFKELYGIAPQTYRLRRER